MVFLTADLHRQSVTHLITYYAAKFTSNVVTQRGTRMQKQVAFENSLVFEKLNGTLVASQIDCVKEKSHFECSQTMMLARYDVTGGRPGSFALENLE